jgi:hypothetical protein
MAEKKCDHKEFIELMGGCVELETENASLLKRVEHAEKLALRVLDQRDAALKRAEAAERERDEARAWVDNERKIASGVVPRPIPPWRQGR